MNKALEALRELRKLTNNQHWIGQRFATSHLDIIETALKELDFYRKRDKQWKQDANKNINKLKALEIVKELFDFDFAIRYGNNQPMLKITNKRTNEYWEIPISKEYFDLLKEELL